MRELYRILKDDDSLYRAVQMMQGVQEYITILTDNATDDQGQELTRLRADASHAS
jgi:hypothetical protein